MTHGNAGTIGATAFKNRDRDEDEKKTFLKNLSGS